MPLSAVMRVKKLFQKARASMAESKEREKEAVKQMDERYPAGWAKNEYHIMEMMEIKKGLKKK